LLRCHESVGDVHGAAIHPKPTSVKKRKLKTKIFFEDP
jgi:hypothetical protein